MTGWLALAILAVVMALVLFAAAGTIRYWQAWVYLSPLAGVSVLTTSYLLRKDRALLEWRMRGDSTAEKRPAQRRRHLPGFTAYQSRVRHRLVPFVW